MIAKLRHHLKYHRPPETSLAIEETQDGAMLGANTIFFSFSTADEDIHAPNEFYRPERFRPGSPGLGSPLAQFGETAARPSQKSYY